MRFASPILFASLIASSAAAEPEAGISASAALPSQYSLGFRVGGYGFKRADDPGAVEGGGGNAWNLCRMNGLGLFAERALRGPFFVEAGLDTYFSIGQGVAGDLPIDRQSLLVTTAAGARTSFTPWLRGDVQLGGGVELARVSVPYSDGSTIRDQKAMPVGFLGVGGDIRIAHGTYVGAQLRVLVMDNFTYDPMQLKMASPWVAPPPPSQVFSTSPDLAAQGQFYLRRDL